MSRTVAHTSRSHIFITVLGVASSLGHVVERGVGMETTSQPLALSLLADAVAVRAISAGHVVTERDVERPLAVTAGSPVWIEIVHGHIRASVLGSALQSGRIGDIVSVRIDTTGKEIKATVSGREQVTRELKRAR